MNIIEEDIMPETQHPLQSDLTTKMRRGKIVSIDEAVDLIKDNDVIGFNGIIGIGCPDELIIALEKKFLDEGHPRNLTLFYASTLGDGKEMGLQHLAHEGLVKKVIGGHFGKTPKLTQMALDEKIECYNLPQGVLSTMIRDIAGGRPRTITKVGLGTFVDPRHGGGKLNAITKENLVELIEFDGQEYLAYKPPKLNVAIIKATSADLEGNISFEKEPLYLDALSLAMAAKNSGGFVLVQVEGIADRGALPMRSVIIPGALVDCVAVATNMEHHRQTAATLFNPAYAHQYRIPVTLVPPIALNERKIIARRAAFELKPNSVVNLGIGVPESISSVAAEEGIQEYLTLTSEPGIIGGIPAGGGDFGAAVNVDALIAMSNQFDFYNGGGLDVAFLGLAEADEQGNLNVSRFGPKIAGCGGFIDISQNAKKVVFMGSFTAGGLKIDVLDGKLRIVQEGKTRKFVKKVEEITFSGAVAAADHKQVLYITERCVFKLTPEGLELVEVAPGIDVERDIAGQMDFRPVIRQAPRLMDQRLFKPAPMELKQDLLTIPIRNRLHYQPEDNLFFVNFEGLIIRSKDQIDEIREAVSAIIEPLGKRVRTIVNYDNFDLSPELIDYYTEMVSHVVGTYYEKVSRYSTGAFLRMKLGDKLNERGMSPYIYETPDEALQEIDD